MIGRIPEPAHGLTHEHLFLASPEVRPCSALHAARQLGLEQIPELLSDTRVLLGEHEPVLGGVGGAAQAVGDRVADQLGRRLESECLHGLVLVGLDSSW